jgi:glucose-6-phosphate isomerase
LRGKNKKFLQESTIKLSKLLTLNKINNIVFLNYFPKLEKFLFWCQQLIAESLGKRGKGFFPIVSNVPKDHHSLLQLYLDGPKDKIFYIFSHNDIFKEKINISRFTNEKSLLNKKKINEVKNAQKKALIEVLKLKKIPFREFEINKINEQALGELFSYFMLETVIIGKLSRINPFDQPAVEQIKDYTKKFLS